MVLLLLINLSIVSTLYSQQAVLNNKGDTTICFDVKKANFLKNEAFKANEMRALYSICERQRLNLNDVVMNNKKEHLKDSVINNNNMQLLQIKQIELDEQKSKTSQAEKNIRKQKVGKWIAIGVGAAVAILEGYIIIKKLN